MKRGIIVGTDAGQEWLLPWWWKYHTRHNTLPVTFVDFGMSKKGLNWCRKRGHLVRLDLNRDFIAPKSAVAPDLAKEWERWRKGRVWEWRAACFNKPFAMALTHYEETVWIDLDCEINAPVDAVFELLDDSTELSVADSERRDFYNSGVVVYKKGASFLKKWADLCVYQNAQFYTDDFALNHLIRTEGLPFRELPREWNWLMKCGINPLARILHWSNEGGKKFIKLHGGLQDHL